MSRDKVRGIYDFSILHYFCLGILGILTVATPKNPVLGRISNKKKKIKEDELGRPMSVRRGPLASEKARGRPNWEGSIRIEEEESE